MSASTDDLYSLHWKNHTKNLKSTFDIFRCDNELVDVTLSCEGRKLKAHKIVLSACSNYFLDLFRDNPCQHPIIILRDVKYQTMIDILAFMYQGEVNVSTDNLDSFLKTAESLQVKGLMEPIARISNYSNESTPTPEKQHKMEQFTGLKKFNTDDVPLEIEDDKDETMAENMEIVKTESEISTADYMDMHLDHHHHHHLSHFPDNSNDMILRTSDNRDQFFPCRFCDKVFSHPNSLKLHLPTHSGSTSCSLCNAVLCRKYELKIHMRKKHNIDLV